MSSPMSPSPASPAPTSPGAKRRSWFSLHLRPKPKAEPSLPHAPPSPSKADAADTSTGDVPTLDTLSERRLRPIQFAPNRIATLYVTPSERNLYLAAMEQLDVSPNPLALWTDPAPTLPSLPPLDLEQQQQNRLPLTLPMSPNVARSPGQPLSSTGLQIRDDLQDVENVLQKSERHALLSLTQDSFMRFTGFPPATLIAVEQTLRGHWPQGIQSLNKTAEQLGMVLMGTDTLTWRVLLHGKVWKCKGNQELDSVRLMVALLTTLAFYGWTLVENTQAGHLENITHNLLFAHSPEVEQRPPAFFAVSIPLPDRLSLISAPGKMTPALLAAIRESIVANSQYSHNRATCARGQTGKSRIRASFDATRSVSWGDAGLAKGVKLEGWVHPGVYRFWIAGMRRWLGGTVKQGRIDKIHPHLVLSLMNNLAAAQVDLVASIPFLPRKKGRDVFYFCTNPASGLTCLDSWKADLPPAPAPAPAPGSAHNATFRASSVPRSTTSSFEIISRVGSHSPARPLSLAKRDAQSDSIPNRDGDSDHSGSLPWTAVLNDGPPYPTATMSLNRASMSAPPPSAMSNKAANPTPNGSSADSTPKQRNVLLKKNSIRRKNTGSTKNDSATVVHQLPPQAEEFIPLGRSFYQQQPSQSSLSQPTAVGGHVVASNFEPSQPHVREYNGESVYGRNHLGLVSRHAPIPAPPEPVGRHYEPQGPVYQSMVPAPTSYSPDRWVHDRQSSSSSLHSGESVYEDTTEYTPPTSLRLPVAGPRPPFPSPLADKPMINSQKGFSCHNVLQEPNEYVVPDTASDVHRGFESNIHTDDSPPLDSLIQEASSPRRAGSAMIESGPHLGINSVHGSVGYFGSQSVINYVPGDHESGRQVHHFPPPPTLLPPVNGGHDGSPSGMAGADVLLPQTRGWEQVPEQRLESGSERGSVLAEQSSVSGSTPDKPGSSRTRMSLSGRRA